MSENNTKRDRLLIELTSIERRLRKLYGDTYRAAVEIKAVRKAIEEGQEFTWDGNPAAAKQLQSLLDTMGQQTNAYLRNATSKAWTEGEEGVHNTLAAVFATTKKSEEEIERITEKAREDMRKRGASGHNYFNEKRGGLTISDRVWNISDTARNEIETIIQNGILEGKSPDQIAKSVQPYLREPHKLFRRVRNKETGELELSQAAKKYKPGRGVYRSAYKNAMRLARTEVTAAYRRAEWETYQNNPLITGFRIELSNNHTTLVKGVPVPFHDICDDMVGIYPKTFLWTGWHPQCRCRMIPVFISKADFKDRMKALAAGKLKDWKPKSTTTDMPENFKKWIQDNSDRIAAARALPYWMQDNKNLINISAALMPEEKLQKQLTADQLYKEVAEHATFAEITTIIKQLSNKPEGMKIQFSWNKQTPEERIETLKKAMSKYNLDILTDEEGAMSNAAYWSNSRRMNITEQERKAIVPNRDINIKRRIEGNELEVSPGYQQTPNSYTINGALRRGKNTDAFGNELTDYDRATIKALDSAISKNITTQRMKVYRIVSADYMKDKFGSRISTLKGDEYINQINQNSGAELTDKAYMSASTTLGSSELVNISGNFARDYLLEIDVPRGTNAYFANNQVESEIIFKRNQQLIFDRIEPIGQNGQYKIICRIDN